MVETTTTTIGEGDIASRADTCTRRPVRALSVSRIDPRKGLRVLPRAVRLLVDAGIDITLDIVGPTVGRPGEDERAAIVDEARRSGVADRVSLPGAVPLDRLLPMYAGYDLFVLPTLPGEGIPRVLLEAMSAGLPDRHDARCGNPEPGDARGQRAARRSNRPADAVAGAMARLIGDAASQAGLIANGYATARTHTLETQAARMMEIVSSSLQVALRHPVVLPVG